MKLEFVSAFGDKYNGDLQNPYGIAVSHDQIVVTDINTESVKIFDHNEYLVNEFGSKGTENGQFDGIHGVCLSSSGRIFVADAWNRRVQVFNPMVFS